MTVHNQWQVNRAVKGGVIAGLLSGVAVMTLLAVMNAVNGRDVWRGLKFASVPFLGSRALDPSFDHVAVVLGVVCHLAIAIFWGTLFGLVFFGLTKAMTLLAGVFWGIVVWIGMLYIAIPALGFPPGGGIPLLAAVLSHVFFGVVMAAAFLPFQRELPPMPRQRPTYMH